MSFNWSFNEKRLGIRVVFYGISGLARAQEEVRTRCTCGNSWKLGMRARGYYFKCLGALSGCRSELVAARGAGQAPFPLLWWEGRFCVPVDVTREFHHGIPAPWAFHTAVAGHLHLLLLGSSSCQEKQSLSHRKEGTVNATLCCFM